MRLRATIGAAAVAVAASTLVAGTALTSATAATSGPGNGERGSGIKHVLLPEQNRKDWGEVPAEVREKIKVDFVRHISDLLPLALKPASTPKPPKIQS